LVGPAVTDKLAMQPVIFALPVLSYIAQVRTR
jgi:hypothetical protein